jgi:hypothetical protein
MDPELEYIFPLLFKQLGSQYRSLHQLSKSVFMVRPQNKSAIQARTNKKKEDDDNTNAL